MKTHTFASALVIAGTVLTNAFTIDSATGYVSLDGGSLTTSDGVSISGDISNGYSLSLTAGSWAGTSDSGTRDDVTFAVTFDCSKIVFGDADMRFFYIDGSRGDLGIGWDVETKCFTATWNNDYDIRTSGIRAENMVTFVFTMGDGGSRIYQNAETGFWTGQNVKGDLGTTNRLVVESVAASALDNLVVWNKDITFSGGNASVTSALQASASLIPEPSAFGLLAGVGALTLTASRRRRK